MLITTNTVQRGDEWGFDWWLFPPTMSDRDITDDLDQITAVDGHECYCSHDCCGHKFRRSITIKRTKTRVLVTQYWGINV